MAELVIATKSGKIIVIDENDLPQEGRGGSGTRINGVRPGDTITAVARVPDTDELVEQAGDFAAGDGNVSEDVRNAIIDVLATRMPHLRESKTRSWLEGSQRTLAEMAEDQQLRFLVAERGVINSRLSSVEERTTENFNAREAIDTRIANRVVHLFRTSS